jgi:hypothetical protein
MPTDLTAASRREHLVVYDPAAIPADTPVDEDLERQEPELPPASTIRSLTSRGAALILHIPEEDCQARMRIFVDEDLPGVIRERGRQVIAGATLRSPAGLLRADGLEFMTRQNEVRTHAQPEDARVAPGEYDVEVHELLSWKLAQRSKTARRQTTPGERAAHGAVTAYTWAGIVMIPLNLFVAPLIVAGVWTARGWRAGFTVLATILVVDAIVFGGFWLLEPLQKRVPALTRVRDADAAFEQENPDIAIVLRTRTSPAASASPAFAMISVRPKA